MKSEENALKRKYPFQISKYLLEKNIFFFGTQTKLFRHLRIMGEREWG